MRLIVEDLARQSLIDIYYYNCQYSVHNAVETDREINLYIYNLEILPYIGKIVSEIQNINVRELIYKRRKSAYRIIYYISEDRKTAHILYVVNTKQNFNKILKLHNYFSNLLKF